jgi:hypothetical protein
MQLKALKGIADVADEVVQGKRSMDALQKALTDWRGDR